MKRSINNILLFTSEFPPLPGGIGNHAYNLANSLSLKGNHVTVLADQRDTSGIETNFDDQLNFKVIRVKINRLRLLMYFKRIRLFFKLASKHDVFIASGKFPLWIASCSTYFFNKKSIAIIHGSEVNFTNRILKKTIDFSLKKFDHIISVSNYTKSLIDYLNLNNIVVIPNGFDSSSWKLRDETYDKLEGDPSLITVGNVTERKGQLNVIKQLPRLKQKFPNVHYHCVGLPTQKDQFLNVARKLGVDKNVTFYGSVSHEVLQKFYGSANIFIMLSNQTLSGDVEGFGIAIIEANYFGLPAIGSLGCGIEDAINNNNSGILVNPNDEDDFAFAVKAINDNYITYKKNAKEWALQHTWQNIIEQYLKVIYS